MTDAPAEPDAAAAAAAAAAPADWRTTLPEDMRADPALEPFKTPDLLAKSYIETKALVGRSLVMPKDDTDEAGWSQLYEKLGRPAEAKDYQIDIPEGAPPEFAEAFRGVAHKAGLSGKQVGELVKFNNEFVAQAMAAQTAAGEAELTAWKGEVGEPAYNEITGRAQAAAKAFGVPDDIANELEAKLGSRKLVEFFANVGKRMGEHGRLAPGDPPGGISADPLAERSSLIKDKAFTDKLNAGDPEAKRRWDMLNAAIASLPPKGA